MTVLRANMSALNRIGGSEVADTKKKIQWKPAHRFRLDLGISEELNDMILDLTAEGYDNSTIGRMALVALLDKRKHNR